MNVVFISPHFPPQYEHFAAALRDRGATVLGVGDAPEESLTTSLRGALASYYFVPNMTDRDAMVRALGLLTHRFGKIDRIESLNEHWLEQEAALRDDFNVFGPREAAMRRWKSKEGMRAVFREHGIPCTEGEPYAGAAKARAFAKRHGFPLVFKPEIGVGAAGAFRVNDDEELNAALEKGGLEGYVVEKFETGRLTTYDGLTDRDGRVVFSTSHLYSAGIMDIVNNKLPMHYYNRREFPDGMEEFGNRIVRAFDLRERFFHIELFDLGDGKYRALEVNFRPPGGFTTDLMNYSADVDVYKLWAEIVATGSAPEQWKFDRAYHACHVSRRDGVSYKYSHEEALKRLGDALVLYRRMPDAFAGAMGNHMYLLRTPDFAELKKLIAVVEART